jgi:hypothetical protein
MHDAHVIAVAKDATDVDGGECGGDGTRAWASAWASASASGHERGSSSPNH